MDAGKISAPMGFYTIFNYYFLPSITNFLDFEINFEPFSFVRNPSFYEKAPGLLIGQK